MEEKKNLIDVDKVKSKLADMVGQFNLELRAFCEVTKTVPNLHIDEIRMVGELGAIPRLGIDGIEVL